MTDHKGLSVSGYTTQSQSNVDLANEFKQVEERYLRLLDKVADLKHIEKPGADLRPAHDGRCLSIARTKIQEANMWAVQPSTPILLKAISRCSNAGCVAPTSIVRKSTCTAIWRSSIFVTTTW